MSDSNLPVHDSLTVLDHQDVYQNEGWWKSAVRYRHKDSDSSEVAMYLWHYDDGWTRKNKYVVRTEAAWETDRAVVDRVLAGEANSNTEFPVSDYYSVAGGETVIKDNGWWKAVVEIDQKGDYETREVVVYLWQRQDESWRRRQKFTIKSDERWEKEASVFESVLYSEEADDSEKTSEETSAPSTQTTESEMSTLEQELDEHLSATLE